MSVHRLISDLCIGNVEIPLLFGYSRSVFFLDSIKQTNGNALVSTLTELRVFQTIRTTFPSGGRHLCFVDIHRHFFTVVC